MSEVVQPMLSRRQLDQFLDQGYLVVENVLDPEADLAPLIHEYSEVLDGIAHSLAAEGVLSSTHTDDDLPFAERLVRLSTESGRNFPQHFDISLPQKGIRRDTPIHLGPAVFHLITSHRLLDVVECIVGPEVFCNPVQHIRMKLPARAVANGAYSGLVSKIPWHQDNGVILEEADEATILTVWLPLNEATVANGCLQVVPGSHRAGLVDHCPLDRGVSIPDRLVPTDQALPLPMKPGSVLLMTQRTIHSSLENETDDQVRLSFDLRYQPVGQPTGRPQFPGFIARSAAHPERVLRDPVTWAQRWYDARERLAEDGLPAFNRWRADSPACA